MRYTFAEINAAPGHPRFRVEYPDPVVFMYSPQVVQVTSVSANAGTQPVLLTVTHVASGRSHTETHRLHNETVRFDIHRIMQLLAPDVDTLLSRLDYEAGARLTEQFTLKLMYKGPDSILYSLYNFDDLTITPIVALYGSLDQGEIYGEHTQRRLWLRFPQTLALWANRHGEQAFITDEAYIYPDAPEGAGSAECDLVNALEQTGEDELLEKLRRGVPLRNLGLTWRERIENGTSDWQEYRLITLVPDNSWKGTYLRWLNRRGEVSYWLFCNSQLRTTTSVRDTFSRYYEGNPAAPADGVYTNERKADYREARELVIGATGLTRDEYEDLCDLAVSPVIERLMLPVPKEDTEPVLVYDGGDSKADADINFQSMAGADTTIEGGEASTGVRIRGPYVWQRVTIAPGTFTRNIRRDTPNLQDLEFIIELPERNTIKL